MKDYKLRIASELERGYEIKVFRCHAKSLTDAIKLAECEKGFIRVIEIL